MSTATAEPQKTPEQIAADNAAAEAAKAKLVPQEVINEFMGMTTGKKPEAKKPDEPATAKPEPKKPDAKPKAAKKPAPKPEPEPAAPEPVDYEKLAAATARGVVEAMKPKEQEKAKEQEPETGFLTEDEREQLPVIKKMEELFPTRYKGLAGKYIANAKAVAEYQAKWEGENPGKEFNPEDDEHDDFFKTHSVEWRDGDELDARAEIRVEKRMKPSEDRTSAELAELRLKDKAREFEPKVVAEAVRVDREVFDQVGGEFKNLLSPEGKVNAETLVKIQNEDPIAAEIVLPAVIAVRNHAAEMLRLENGIVKFNPENPMHKYIADFAERQEQEILKLPKAQQANAEGKKFATSEEYAKMSAKDRTTHYRLMASDLNSLLAAEQGALLVQRVDNEKKRVDALAVKMGYSKGALKKPDDNEPPAKPKDEGAEAEEEEIQSPTTTGVQIPTQSAKGGAGTQKTANGGFFKDF